MCYDYALCGKKTHAGMKGKAWTGRNKNTKVGKLKMRTAVI